jgi:hypothetical protein
LIFIDLKKWTTLRSQNAGQINLYLETMRTSTGLIHCLERNQPVCRPSVKRWLDWAQRIRVHQAMEKARANVAH